MASFAQQPGDLDSTFNLTGIKTTPIGNSHDVANAIAIQTNGKIVVAGYTNNGSANEMAILRYNSDGSIDNSFNTNGIFQQLTGNECEANAVLIQPDGKIIAAGYSKNSTPDFDFLLIRLNVDGTVDNSFGTGGIVTTDFNNANNAINAIQMQTDGKLVVAGYCTISGIKNFALARYNVNGTLDLNFGLSGKIISAPGTGDCFAYDMSIQTDGKIIAAGFTGNPSYKDFVLLRYNNNGTPDSTFNLNGNHLFSLARFNTDGSLDNTFNVDGKVNTIIAGYHDDNYAATLQADGKIVAVGDSYNNLDFDIAAVRYIGDSVLTAAPIIENNNIKITPNPFTNRLTISGTNAKSTIKIFNLMGVEVLNQVAVDGESVIKTENLLPGFYLISYNGNNTFFKAKVLKI